MDSKIKNKLNKEYDSGEIYFNYLENILTIFKNDTIEIKKEIKELF